MQMLTNMIFDLLYVTLFLFRNFKNLLPRFLELDDSILGHGSFIFQSLSWVDIESVNQEILHHISSYLLIYFMLLPLLSLFSLLLLLVDIGDLNWLSISPVFIPLFYFTSLFHFPEYFFGFSLQLWIEFLYLLSSLICKTFCSGNYPFLAHFLLISRNQ